MREIGRESTKQRLLHRQSRARDLKRILFSGLDILWTDNAMKNDLFILTQKPL